MVVILALLGYTFFYALRRQADYYLYPLNIMLVRGYIVLLL